MIALRRISVILLLFIVTTPVLAQEVKTLNDARGSFYNCPLGECVVVFNAAIAACERQKIVCGDGATQSPQNFCEYGRACAYQLANCHSKAADDYATCLRAVAPIQRPQPAPAKKR